ncbi:MAG: cation transporter [Patescibacteria group bacterium]|nr:cation transporter [Patescibacteria group bacterium]
MTQTHKFKISGMHCTSCAMNIDGELEDAPGVKEATTNYARQETVVKYDDGAISLPQLKAIIEKTGYRVSE